MLEQGALDRPLILLVINDQDRFHGLFRKLTPTAPIHPAVHANRRRHRGE
jgi:hypothetical protein